MNSADANKDESGEKNKSESVSAGSATPSTAQPTRIRSRFPRAMPNVAAAGRSAAPSVTSTSSNEPKQTETQNINSNSTDTSKKEAEAVNLPTSELSIDTTHVTNKSEESATSLSPSKSSHTQMSAPESPSKKHTSFAGLFLSIFIIDYLCKTLYT
jgi:hypothetical protein